MSEDTKKSEMTHTLGLSASEFGSALIEEATKRRDKEKLNKSVRVAETILATLDDIERQLAHLEGWKITRTGQLEALRTGAFTFDVAGEITYNDEALNRR